MLFQRTELWFLHPNGVVQTAITPVLGDLELERRLGEREERERETETHTER